MIFFEGRFLKIVLQNSKISPSFYDVVAARLTGI